MEGRAGQVRLSSRQIQDPRRPSVGWPRRRRPWRPGSAYTSRPRRRRRTSTRAPARSKPGGSPRSPSARGRSPGAATVASSPCAGHLARCLTGEHCDFARRGCPQRRVALRLRSAHFGPTRPTFFQEESIPLMPRTRQQNVTAAQWSPNGDALGSPDLTVAGNQVFGENVFSPTVQRHRLPKHVYKALARTLARGEALDTTLADAVAQAMSEWAMEKGATHYTHWFQPLTGLDGREARLVLRPVGRRHGAGGVLGQGADPGRARRLVVPDRWYPRDVRGARLHRLGPDVAGVHPREPQRRAAVHPHGVHVVDGRGARSQDPAAALDGRAVRGGRARAGPARRRRRRARVHDDRLRAGVLPDRRAVLLRASRSGDDRPHAVRRQAAEGPRARRPLFRLDPRARSSRTCSRWRWSWPSSACRSRRATTRSRRTSSRSRRSSRTRTSAPTTRC